MKVFAARVPAPSLALEALVVVRADGALRRLDFIGRRTLEELVERAERAGCDGEALVWDDGPAAEVRDQLEQYFAGDRREFDLPLDLVGTPFQLRVWEALRSIPYGSTWSYGELAAHIGSPAASRAVGRANGTNPVSLVVPCHRVIGADGRLTGYGGGLPTKKALLDFERGQRTFAARG